MACDGTNFAYVDMQNNCQLTGPCNRQSIATLLRVELEPEDFLHLALGNRRRCSATRQGTVTWDGKTGHERVTLTGPTGTQTIVIDAARRPERRVESELKDARRQGDVVGRERRLRRRSRTQPGASTACRTKTRFKSPQENADLLVEWGERTVNPTIDDAKFTVQVPPGLPTCGAKK